MANIIGMIPGLGTFANLASAGSHGSSKPIINRRPNISAKSGPGFISRAGTRLSNIGFGLSNWDSLFSRWFPSVTRAVSVKVQGAKGTPEKDVLHLALATAFGVLNSADTKAVNYGLKVSIDHVNNTVSVDFAITTIAAIELFRALTDLVAYKKALDLWGVGDTIGADEQKLLDEVWGLLDVAGGFVPLVMKWFGAEGSKKNLGKGIAVLKFLFDSISRKIGGGQVWSMPRNEIRAGPPLIGLGHNEKIPEEPFDLMLKENNKKGMILFTREPAANPQPPAAGGNDLRSLVAQVLHDPGTRPPSPYTDIGPPTVDNEKKGK